MSISKKNRKGKKKRRKTAKDYGDRTPADYEADKKRVRKLAKKHIAEINRLKTRSISLDRKARHKEQAWERR